MNKHPKFGDNFDIGPQLQHFEYEMNRTLVMRLCVQFSIIFSILSRFPIPLCKKLGKITATYRWFAIVYVVGMFFVMPGFFVLLTLIDSSGITMYTFMLIVFVLITG